jgi:hypothetical protein
MWRMRVRPGKAPSVLVAVVGVAMLLVFVLFFLPTMDSIASRTPMGGVFSGFGLLVVLVLLAMIGFAVYNVVSPRGASMIDVDLYSGGPRGIFGPQSTGGETEPVPGPAVPDAFDARLRKLQALRDDGLITIEEYERKRGEILAERW